MIHEMDAVYDRVTREISGGRCAQCGVEWDASMPPLVAFGVGASPCRPRVKYHCCDGSLVRRVCDLTCVERYARVDMWGPPRLSTAARALLTAPAHREG